MSIHFDMRYAIALIGLVIGCGGTAASIEASAGSESAAVSQPNGNKGDSAVSVQDAIELPKDAGSSGHCKPPQDMSWLDASWTAYNGTFGTDGSDYCARGPAEHDADIECGDAGFEWRCVGTPTLNCTELRDGIYCCDRTDAPP